MTNSFVVNFENSSEVWGGFRVGRRANPSVNKIQIDRNRETNVIKASHNGYRFLSVPAVHVRQVECTRASLVVHDEVCGKSSEVKAHYHFHPNIVMKEVTPTLYLLTLPNNDKLHLEILSGKPSREMSTWHPGFGMTQENIKLVVEAVQSEIKIKFSVDNEKQICG